MPGTALRVALLSIGLMAAGCASRPTPAVALGPWGGPHVSMDVTSTGARLEYDCATGAIEGPLRPDADGRFTATGTHTPGHGGPIREGEVLPSFPARYAGRVQGEQMSLTVTLTAGDSVGSFDLRRGAGGFLFKCL